MKSLKVLATIFLALLLVSCDEDDTLVNVSESDLVGVWNLTKLTQEGTIEVSGFPVPLPVTSEGSDYDAVVEITSNPNNFSAKGSFTNTATVDNPIGEDIKDVRAINLNELFTTGTWSVTDGVLTVSQAGIDQAIDIISYDGTTIELKFEAEIPILFEGTNFVSKSTIKISLSK